MSKKIPLLILTLLITMSGLLLKTDSFGATATKAGFSPDAITVQTGQTFYLTVVVNDISDLYACQSDINYSTTYLEMVNAVKGPFLDSDGAQTYFVAPTIEPGKARHGALTRMGCDEGVDGSGTIVYIVFRALKKTTGTTVSLGNILLVDRNAQNIDKGLLNSGRCRITISDEAPALTQPPVEP